MVLILGILIGILLGFFLTRPVTAKAPEASYAKPEIQTAAEVPKEAVKEAPKRPVSKTTSRVASQAHPTESATPVSVEKIRAYLKESPLAPYSEQIAQSRYAGTIIGICTIEERNCNSNPFGSNNFWGLMGRGGLLRFATLEDGITYIDSYLTKAAAGGHDTIEKLNGWYVVPASTNWLNTVIRVKSELEQ